MSPVVAGTQANECAKMTAMEIRLRNRAWSGTRLTRAVLVVARLGVELAEQQCGVTARRFGPTGREITDGRNCNFAVVRDVSERETSVLEVPNACCPCAHHSTLRDTVTFCQPHPVTVFRCTSTVSTLGERIKNRRVSLGIERKELGDRAGIPYSTIADIESGLQKGSTQLYRIAEVLKTNCRFLDTGKGKPDAIEPGAPAGEILTEAEAKLLAAFRAAKPAGRITIQATAESVIPKRRSKHSDPFVVPARDAAHSKKSA